MVHVGPEVADKLQNVFVKAMNTSLLIVLFFVLQRIFDMNFQCSCENSIYDVLYVIAPALILIWVLGYIESYNPRTRWGMSKWSCICQTVPKVVSVFAVWITAVLLDGDWFICVKTNLHETLKGLPCKEEDKLVDKEKESINELKIQSVQIGMIVICAFLLLWTVVKVGLIWHCRFKHQKQKKFTDLCCPPYYKVVYEYLLEEQVSKHLEEQLTKLAGDRAHVLCQNHLTNIREGGEDAENGWSEISTPGFYMKPETPEERRQREEPQHQGQENQREREEPQQQGRENQREREEIQHQRRENQREREEIQHQRRENQREREEPQQQGRENQREREEPQHQRRENQREREEPQHQRRENQREREEIQHQRRENQREREEPQQQGRENQREREEPQHQRRENQREREEPQHQRRENQREREEPQHQRRENQRERDEIQHQRREIQRLRQGAIELELFNRPTSQHSGEEH